MPDLKTHLGDYFDRVVQRVTVEDVVELRVDARLPQPVRPRNVGSLPGWLYGLTAAVVILVFGFVGWLASNRGDVEERQPVGSPATSTTVNPDGIASQTVDGVSFSFVIPAQGWEVFDGLFMSKSTQGPQGAEAIIYWARFPEGALASACASVERFWPEPQSATALAYAVASVPGMGLLSGPSEVTVGGRAALHLSLMILEDTGCDPGFFYNWRARMGGAIWDRTFLGDTIDVWIVDVEGVRLFIAGITHTDASEKVSEEIQQIIESIQFH